MWADLLEKIYVPHYNSRIFYFFTYKRVKNISSPTCSVCKQTVWLFFVKNIACLCKFPHSRINKGLLLTLWWVLLLNTINRVYNCTLIKVPLPIELLFYMYNNIHRWKVFLPVICFLAPSYLWGSLVKKAEQLHRFGCAGHCSSLTSWGGGKESERLSHLKCSCLKKLFLLHNVWVLHT